MTTNILWQAEDIIRALNGRCLHDQSWFASGVSIDTRTLKKGDLFIALKGPQHDGHDHVAAAFTAGAAGAIVSKQPSQAPTSAPLIFVEDTFRALEQLGLAGRARSKAKIIAVTGSVGKTGTKEMLRLMLTASGTTFATEGSLNNHWGVPLSLARLPPDDEYAVFELGMNHAGEMRGLSQQVKPAIALITTIEAVHLEFFASLEAIADAKAEIYEGMNPKEGSIILNRDNNQYNRLLQTAKTQGFKNILSFGRLGKGEAILIDTNSSPEGIEIKAEIAGRPLTYRLPVPGEHIALNSIGALLAVVTAGADVEASAIALNRYQLLKGRGVVSRFATPKGNITVIDESYNASPASIRAAIAVLKNWKESPCRRLLILGDMRELGPNAPALHEGLAKDLVNSNIDRVYCCGEMMKYLFDALPISLQGSYAANSLELSTKITNDLRDGDVITVKGSNSMAMVIVVEALRALNQSLQHPKLAS